MGNFKTVKHFRPSGQKAGSNIQPTDPGIGAAINKVSKARSFGVGESKNFGANDPAYRPDLDWSKLTIGGKKIMQYLWGKVFYSQTDQGMAELQKGQDPLPRGQVMSDRTPSAEIEDADKDIVRFADTMADDEEFHIARDPFEDVVKRHTPSGHRGMMFSKIKVEKEGMVRNGMEYKPVLVKNPQTGIMENITVGGMFLGSVPEGIWMKSKQYFERLTTERMAAVTQRVNEQSQRVMGKTDLQNLARRRHQDADTAGMQLDDPDSAAEELGMLEHEDA